MGKHRMRDKKRRKLERAASAGDMPALEKLALRAPVVAARTLMPLLARDQAHADRAALDTLAARVAEALRRAGRPDLCLELAALGAGRSQRLRLEEALAAFALGDDARAERSAHADPDVERALAPLLAAARSSDRTSDAEPAGPARRGKRRETWIDCAARLVAAARRGQKSRAQTAARSLRADGRGGALAPMAGALTAAAELACAAPGSASARRCLGALLDDGAVVHNPPALQALLGEAADKCGVEVVYAALQARGIEGPMVRELRRRELVELDQLDPGAACAAIQRAGADAFPGEARATARLFEGFAWLPVEPEQARALFERALSEGADPVECLRGRFLAAHAELGRDRRRAIQELASTGLGLSQAFEADPDGASAAAIVARDVAQACAHGVAKTPSGRDLNGIDEIGRTWCRRLQSFAARLGTAGDALLADADLLEASVSFFSEPEQLLEIADRMIRREPGSAQAWRLKLTAAERSQHPELAAWRDEAARATRDPKLVAEARRDRLEAGLARPFENLDPRDVQAGVLAAELAWALAAEVARDGGTPLCCGRYHPPLEPNDDAALARRLQEVFSLAGEQRAMLAESERTAFDGASIACACATGSVRVTASVLSEAVTRASDVPRAIERIVALVLGCQFGEALPNAGRKMTAAGATPAALCKLVEAVAVHDRDCAGDVLVAVAPSLDIRSLRRARGAVESRSFRDDVISPERVLAELDGMLAPAFSTRDVMEEGLRAPRFAREAALEAPAESDGGLPEDEAREAVAVLLGMLGIDATLSHLSSDEIAALEMELGDIVSGEPTPAATVRLFETLARFGVGPPGGIAHPTPPALVLTRRDRNREKRKRRERER